MAIIPETQYPGKIAPSSAAYPYGQARNITTPGDGTGTPFEAAMLNDIFGFQQSLLARAGIVPSGTPDEVGASQYLRALQAISGSTVTDYAALIALWATGSLDAGDVVTLAGAGIAGAGTVVHSVGHGYTSTAGNIVSLDLDFYWRRHADNIAHAPHFNIAGNNSGAPYSSEMTTIMSLGVSDGVYEIRFPDNEIYVDNSGGPWSFQSGVKYVGGPNTVFKISDPSQRCFYTSSKTDFELNNMRVNGTEGSGDEDLYVGGGYLRFDSCTDFRLYNCEASNSFGTGLKCSLCSGFTIRDWVSNYNQFTGFELEGCSSYSIENWTSSYNGRYSANDGFKPLPTGWSGTHGGRAWVVAASGSTVDQKNALIGFGRGELNSEYGGRVFAAATKAPTNLTITDNYFTDNGAPAGTYGTVVLGSDKGVDFLINSDASGESDNIRWDNVQINRSLGFGTPISVDGNNHRQTRTKVVATGAARHVVTACSIFGGEGFISDGLDSSGCANHVSFGGGSPESVTFRNCTGKDNLKAFSGTPAGGVNTLTGGEFTHRATAAVSGEVGIVMSTVKWVVHKCSFDGYFRGIEPQGTAPSGEVTECVTLNTVGTNGGFYANSVTDQSSLSTESNNFDTAFPGIFATFVHNRRGSLNKKLWFWNSSPTSGVANAGGNMNYDLGDMVINTAGVVGQPKGWVCTTAGTPGTWTSTGNL